MFSYALVRGCSPLIWQLGKLLIGEIGKPTNRVIWRSVKTAGATTIDGHMP
jgi:hypothetical protein